MPELEPLPPEEATVPNRQLPRCASCRWWKPFPDTLSPKIVEAVRAAGISPPVLGDCTLFECTEFEQVHHQAKLQITRTQSGEATVVTGADFGCVQWEPRRG